MLKIKNKSVYNAFDILALALEKGTWGKLSKIDLLKRNVKNNVTCPGKHISN